MMVSFLNFFLYTASFYCTLNNLKWNNLGHSPPKKRIPIFWEMDFSCSNIKKILIFFQMKAFVIFLKMELFTSNPKWNFLALIFFKKWPCFLKRKHFIYLRKRNPSLFNPSLRNKRILFQKPRKFFIFNFLHQNFFTHQGFLHNQNFFPTNLLYQNQKNSVHRQ